MPLYKLKSVKINREEDGGTRKLYNIGDTVELTEEQAKAYGDRIEKVQPIEFVPDKQQSTATIQDENEEEEGDTAGTEDSIDTSILNSNVNDVTDYLNDNADDTELLEALRTAEKKDKNRKTVLDTIDKLLEAE